MQKRDKTGQSRAEQVRANKAEQTRREGKGRKGNSL
jgi:hypothetical protein